VQSLKHEQASVRLAAVRRVAASKDPQAMLALVDLLGDPALEVREAAAAELGNHDDPALIRQLDRSARTGRGVQQSNALSVLGRIPDGKATETLIRFVREANDPPTRVEGLSALGQQAQRLRGKSDGSPTDAALLKDALTVGERASREDSPQARRAAVAVLGAAPAGRMRLEEMAKADPSEDVRTAAIEQLRYRSAVKSR
jgi:HEAT repeat protein